MLPQEIVMEMAHVSKEFDGFYANKNINLNLYQGEVHALLGENGAGKSTLMNILSGLLEPSSGQIFIKGQAVTIDSPNEANRLGIGMVHQHFMLVDAFTVLENIILGQEPNQFGWLDKDEAREKVQSLIDRYGLEVDLDSRVSQISVGMQQRIEILKVLYRGADLLIFDEPTAALTPQEIDDLMDTLRALTAEGKSIIIITHKLEEIMAVADRCTVIRRGESVATCRIEDTNSQELASLMVGRSVSFQTEKKVAHPGQTVLQVENLKVKDGRGLLAVNDLSLEVRSGEIVGIAGIDGNGQSELMLALNGLLPVESGKLSLKDQDMTRLSPRQINEAGLAHIPEDRHKHGLILDMTVKENLLIKDYYHEPYANHGLLQDAPMTKQAKELINAFDVRTVSEQVAIRSLSGGNQQKAIIARELSQKPDLLLAANPTRGLDVGAIEFIHQAIIDSRDSQKAVLLMSFELDEIMNLSDRILVMYEGKIVANLEASSTNQEEIGLLMAGTRLEDIPRLKQGGQVYA
ncbi:ABC transporter ATP-binding protein [Hutsoniella sourekii]|uniref:ABC transporter ATP-binding protein n=1 Tax=Hutsoniella sourekii TaxID=87650 RepID=UPI002E1A56E9